MVLELEGTLLNILPEVGGTARNGNPWMKQEFVLETHDQYPKKVCMSVWGEKVNDLKSYAVGDRLRVQLNLESREHNGRWYTEARAWRIELADDNQFTEAGNPPAAAPRPAQQPDRHAAPARPAAPQPSRFQAADENDDLPF